jgi:transposase
VAPGPAHGGEPIRDDLATPELRLRLVPLPGYSPDDHAAEVIWDWIREDVTANTCLGTRAKVREKVGAVLPRLGARTEEVKSRRTSCVLRPTSCIILDVAAHAGRRKT